MSEPNEPAFYCECCQNNVLEDEWHFADELCVFCHEAALETAEYRAWVLRGG